MSDIAGFMVFCVVAVVLGLIFGGGALMVGFGGGGAMSDLLDLGLFAGLLCLIPAGLLVVGGLGWGAIAGVRNWRAARLEERRTQQIMELEKARAAIELERARLDLALVQPVNGVLPMARALLESGILVDQQLQLAMQHVLNNRPLQPVPQTLTYSPAIHNRQDIAGAPSEAAAQLATVNTSKDFWQLWQQGAMPGDKFLMGYDMETGNPIHADWKALYSALIGGQSGSGKSTLIRNILAQSALQGGLWSLTLILAPGMKVWALRFYHCAAGCCATWPAMTVKWLRLCVLWPMWASAAWRVKIATSRRSFWLWMKRLGF